MYQCTGDARHPLCARTCVPIRDQRMSRWPCWYRSQGGCFARTPVLAQHNSHNQFHGASKWPQGHLSLKSQPKDEKIHNYGACSTGLPVWTKWALIMDALGSQYRWLGYQYRPPGSLVDLTLQGSWYCESPFRGRATSDAFASKPPVVSDQSET